jgi:hypothetical protein
MTLPVAWSVMVVFVVKNLAGLRANALAVLIPNLEIILLNCMITRKKTSCVCLKMVFFYVEPIKSSEKNLMVESDYMQDI